MIVGAPSLHEDIDEVRRLRQSKTGKVNFTSLYTGALARIVFADHHQHRHDTHRLQARRQRFADVMGDPSSKLMLNGIATSLPLIKGGKIRAFREARRAHRCSLMPRPSPLAFSGCER